MASQGSSLVRASKQRLAKTPKKTHSVSPLGINVSDVDLHRAVILGLDQAVGGAALARDVQVDGGARCVLFSEPGEAQGRGVGSGEEQKTVPRRHYSRIVPQHHHASPRNLRGTGLLTRPLVPSCAPSLMAWYGCGSQNESATPRFCAPVWAPAQVQCIRPCSAPSWRPRLRAMMRRANLTTTATARKSAATRSLRPVAGHFRQWANRPSQRQNCRKSRPAR